MDACLRRWSSGSQFHVYVAQACNLRCSYCFNAQGAFGGPRRYMNLETAQAAARFIAAHTAPQAPFLNVRFFGGEPMLGRNAMAEIMRRLVESGRPGLKVRFAIDTNGTLLDRKSLEYFDSLGCVQLNVSLDGSREATDANRRGRQGAPTWDRVVRNVRRAQHCRVDLGVTAVLTRANCDAGRVIAELRGLGFHSLTLTPVWRSPLNPGTAAVEMDAEAELRYVTSMAAALREYFRELRQAMEQSRPPDYFLANAATVLESLQAPVATRPVRRCAGGALAIDCEGNLLPCAAMAHLPAFRIGHISTGIDSGAAERFFAARLSILEIEKCRRCWARLRCRGPCLQFVPPLADLSALEPPEFYCHMRQRDIRLGLAVLRELEREHGPLFEPLIAYARGWFGTCGPISDSPRGNG